MIIEPPTTLEEYEDILKTILLIQGSVFCDHLMFIDLEEKRVEVEAIIEDLKTKLN